MTATPFYVTTSIPYVNARPHLGFALEIVQADVLARHHRLRGDQVRFQTGTDDNSLTNVRAAEAEGVPVQRLVDRNAEAFRALRGRCRCRSTTSSAPAATRATAPGSSGCGGRAPPPATSTASTTRGCTASAASSSTPRRSFAAAAAQTTTSSWSWSPRRTGSSGSPATRSGCTS